MPSLLEQIQQRVGHPQVPRFVRHLGQAAEWIMKRWDD